MSKSITACSDSLPPPPPLLPPPPPVAGLGVALTVAVAVLLAGFVSIAAEAVVTVAVAVNDPGELVVTLTVMVEVADAASCPKLQFTDVPESVHEDGLTLPTATPLGN